jgi:hypothetical protein
MAISWFGEQHEIDIELQGKSTCAQKKEKCGDGAVGDQDESRAGWQLGPQRRRRRKQLELAQAEIPVPEAPCKFRYRQVRCMLQALAGAFQFEVAVLLHQPPGEPYLPAGQTYNARQKKRQTPACGEHTQNPKLHIDSICPVCQGGFSVLSGFGQADAPKAMLETAPDTVAAFSCWLCTCLITSGYWRNLPTGPWTLQNLMLVKGLRKAGKSFKSGFARRIWVRAFWKDRG